jgi:hypothetical protein
MAILKQHELEYIVQHRKIKKFGFCRRSVQVIPHGGNVEVRILGNLSELSAQKIIEETVLIPPSAVDAGFEHQELFNLIWNPTITQV